MTCAWVAILRGAGRAAGGRLAVTALLCVGLMACGGGDPPITHPQPDEQNPVHLEPDEVQSIIQHAALALNQPIAVAVTDRRGVVLGVATTFGVDHAAYATQCATACPATDFPISSTSDCAVVNLAVQLARTAAFFSANETPLTSRSVRFLSGVHFPPGILNTAAAALFGIENTNRGCAFDITGGPTVATIPRAMSLAADQEFDPGLTCESATDPSARCGCTTGIATLPGAVPIYKNGTMVGGVGVAIRGVTPLPDPVAAADAPNTILRRSDSSAAYTLAEFMARAFAGDGGALPGLIPKGLKNVCQATPGIKTPDCCTQPTPCFFGILPAPQLPFDPVIFVDGVEIPEVELNPAVSGVGSGNLAQLTYVIMPRATAAPAPSQWLVVPQDSSGPVPVSAAEVTTIINAAISKAYATRAAIRLPLQQRTAMVLAVADTTGTLLGVYRMPDATVFSIDVAVAKARNVNYFSSTTVAPVDRLDCAGVGDCSVTPFFPLPGYTSTAITNRTLSFGAQPFFPSGIDGTTPGPFRRIFIEDSGTPCTNAGEPTNGRQNGIVFFPGSAPLYRNGVLIGGLGVSGDGVEQDDIVTFAGTVSGSGFEPPAAIRADYIEVRGVRLPYLKFNRRPEQ